MEMIYDKFHEEYKDINWLINHQIYLNSNTNNFAVYKKFSMIGYSRDTVVICYIKPQFNTLNCDKTQLQSIFDTFIIKNVESKDRKDKEKNFLFSSKIKRGTK